MRVGLKLGRKGPVGGEQGNMGYLTQRWRGHEALCEDRRAICVVYL